MATGTKKTYVVAHPKFNVMVEGKMSRVNAGDEIDLTDEQAGKAGNRVKLAASGKKITTGKSDK